VHIAGRRRRKRSNRSRRPRHSHADHCRNVGANYLAGTALSSYSLEGSVLYSAGVGTALTVARLTAMYGVLRVAALTALFASAVLAGRRHGDGKLPTSVQYSTITRMRHMYANLQL
jgi:hypothetical protein